MFLTAHVSIANLSHNMHEPAIYIIQLQYRANEDEFSNFIVKLVHLATKLLLLSFVRDIVGYEMCKYDTVTST